MKTLSKALGSSVSHMSKRERTPNSSLILQNGFEASDGRMIAPIRENPLTHEQATKLQSIECSELLRVSRKVESRRVELDYETTGLDYKYVDEPTDDFTVSVIERNDDTKLYAQQALKLASEKAIAAQISRMAVIKKLHEASDASLTFIGLELKQGIRGYSEMAILNAFDHFIFEDKSPWFPTIAAVIDRVKLEQRRVERIVNAIENPPERSYSPTYRPREERVTHESKLPASILDYTISDWDVFIPNTQETVDGLKKLGLDASEWEEKLRVAKESRELLSCTTHATMRDYERQRRENDRYIEDSSYVENNPLYGREDDI